MTNWTEEQVAGHLAKIAGKAPKRSTMSEAQFQREVMKIATLFNWKFYHTHDSIGSQAGFPDLALVRKDRFFFAELKTESGKVSREQQKWLDQLENARVVCYLWRPSMMDEIIKVLK